MEQVGVAVTDLILTLLILSAKSLAIAMRALVSNARRRLNRVYRSPRIWLAWEKAVIYLSFTRALQSRHVSKPNLSSVPKGRV